MNSNKSFKNKISKKLFANLYIYIYIYIMQWVNCRYFELLILRISGYLFRDLSTVQQIKLVKHSRWGKRATAKMN